jgi:hypothetical protein
MKGWMEGGIDGWMEGGMDEELDGWMYKWIMDRLMKALKNSCSLFAIGLRENGWMNNGWIDEGFDGIDGWMGGRDGCRDRWMEGWMSG